MDAKIIDPFRVDNDYDYKYQVIFKKMERLKKLRVRQVIKIFFCKLTLEEVQECRPGPQSDDLTGFPTSKVVD